MKRKSLLAAVAAVGASLALGVFTIAGGANLLKAQLLNNLLSPVVDPIVDPISDPVNNLLDPVSGLTEPVLDTLDEILGGVDDIYLGEDVENLLVTVEDAGLPLDQLIPIEVEAPVYLGEDNSVTPTLTFFIEEEQPVDVAINYVIHGSTSTPGEDFVPQIGTAVIKAGDLDVEVPFDIINDTIEEPVEQILVTVFDPVNALLPEDVALEINLEDDDFLGLSITPTCLNVNEGQGVYNISLTGQPDDVVVVDLDPTNNVNLDVSSITISPENWDTPQQVTIEALEGTIYDLIHTNNVLFLADSADADFIGQDVLGLDIFFSDEGERTDNGLANIDGCTLPLSCDPANPDCNPEPCDPSVQSCDGDGGNGGGGSGPGNGGGESTSHGGHCLELVDDRDLTFLDLDEAFPNEVAYIDVLRRTRETQQNQFVISGYANPEELTTSDLSNPDDSFITYIGPRNNIVRLELAKVLLLAHCYPILDATTLDETADGRPLAAWSDLPREHNGDEIHDELVDIAYSANYWGLWEGYRDNTIRIGNEISSAEGIKLFVRIGEIVEEGLPSTFDDPSDQWWQNFYNKAKEEGTVVQLRNIMNVGEPVQRGTGIIELLKGMLIRNMYLEEDRYDALDYLIDNTTGDPNADAKITELDPAKVFEQGVVLLNKDLNITIPEEGNRVDMMAQEIFDSLPEYLKTKEREEMAYYLAREILGFGLPNGRTVKLMQDGTVQEASNAPESESSDDQEGEAEEEKIEPGPIDKEPEQAEFGF